MRSRPTVAALSVCARCCARARFVLCVCACVCVCVCVFMWFMKTQICIMTWVWQVLQGEGDL